MHCELTLRHPRLEMAAFVKRMEGGSDSSQQNPGWYSIVGLTLACCSGFFVGLSLILQKKGQIETKAQSIALGKQVSYLTNKFWWCGMLSSTRSLFSGGR
jgi:succinate dehydrogenase/fumarate reductase cytochrome b subunit